MKKQNNSVQLKTQTMQMVKIQIPKRSHRAKTLETITRRGRVLCLPENVFIVPEPAVEVLESLGVEYQELGRGGQDYAEKARRNSVTGKMSCADLQ